MEPIARSVLLIRSEEFGWTDLRAMLRSMPEVRRVDEVRTRSQAITVARRRKSDVVITASTVERDSALPLVRELRQILGPLSPLLVIATDFEAEEIPSLAYIGITGYLLWRDLNPEQLRHCLALVFGGSIVLGSQSIVDAFLQSRGGTLRSQPPVPLTDREQAVLKGLSRGLTQEQIAETEYLSLRTVKRTIAGVTRKLGARTTFLLGMRANQLGFDID